MDRRFLSQAEVITASRKFVCVRLATYEDRQEAEFLKSLFVGRSGDLENTTFAILSPDGQRQLARSHRSPTHTQSGAAQLAQTMNRIAGQYQVQKSSADAALPKAASVRLALDIAACDRQPLAVLHASDADALRLLEDRLRALAWSDDFVGQLVYAATDDGEQLKAIDGLAPGNVLLIVQPDQFGLKGKVLAQASAKASKLEWQRALRTGIEQQQRVERTLLQHIQDGQRDGVFWETRIPVTDPLEKRAREKGPNPPPAR
jgi:hypothetical protein